MSLMNQFWEAYNNGILSDDLLPVIEKILKYCEGHYTVWYHTHLVILPYGFEGRTGGRSSVALA